MPKINEDVPGVAPNIKKPGMAPNTNAGIPKPAGVVQNKAPDPMKQNKPKIPKPARAVKPMGEMTEDEQFVQTLINAGATDEVITNLLGEGWRAHLGDAASQLAMKEDTETQDNLSDLIMASVQKDPIQAESIFDQRIREKIVDFVGNSIRHKNNV